MLRSELCNYRDAYIVLKGRITVEGDSYDKTRNESSKIILRLDHAYQKSIPYLQTIQKILILSCQLYCNDIVILIC